MGRRFLGDSSHAGGSSCVAGWAENRRASMVCANISRLYDRCVNQAEIDIRKWNKFPLNRFARLLIERAVRGDVNRHRRL